MPSPRNQQKRTEQPKPAAKAKFKLRPIEMIAVGLLLVAVMMYALGQCGGRRKPTETPANAAQLADSAQLEARASNLRPLYVVVDSLKLRSKPQLDSNFIRYLSYDEIVFDMGVQTDFMQTIRFSIDDVRTEPWVKIRTNKGEVGWVFGAGVHFYRKKRRAAMPAAASTVTTPSATNTTATTPSATTTTAPATTTATNPSATPRPAARPAPRPTGSTFRPR